MKTVLITGTAGFIGSNFLEVFLNKNQEYRVVSVDKLTYAGDMANISHLMSNNRHSFIKGDICDKELISSIFLENKIDGVINFAAESHVDNSISNPESFIQTNINGTFNLLNIAYNSWMQEPFVPKNGYENCRFLQISTDEVYGSLGETGYFTELSKYSPNSPYSASKASADMLVKSYFHTFGLNTIITNCSNNYGPKQHGEKLIPTIINSAISGKNIPIYGDGNNVRDWLYVQDHCDAVNIVFFNSAAGESYNIGGNVEKTNNQIVNIICEKLDEKYPRKDNKSYKEQIVYVKDRPGHDKRYAIDASKIKNELKWQPNESFESGIEKTIEWYLNKILNLKRNIDA